MNDDRRHMMAAFQATDGSPEVVFHCDLCGRLVLVTHDDSGASLRVLVPGDALADHSGATPGLDNVRAVVRPMDDLDPGIVAQLNLLLGGD